jgi:hypothetical protein
VDSVKIKSIEFEGVKLFTSVICSFELPQNPVNATSILFPSMLMAVLRLQQPSIYPRYNERE